MTLRFGEMYNGGFYHVFNRGVDKRIVFQDRQDYEHFLFLIQLLNSKHNIGSLRDVKNTGLDVILEKIKSEEPLVEIYAYALVGNHFHLIIKQVQENGVSLFMQKLSMAYTKYFNEKNKRSGCLFQGKYKFIQIKNDNQLMRLIAYVNNNYEIHKIRPPTSVDITSQDKYLVEETIKIFANVNQYKNIAKQVIKETLSQRSIQAEININLE